MDITEFFPQIDVSNDIQPTEDSKIKKIKKILGSALCDKFITLNEYDLCMEYIKDCSLKNGKYFDNVVSKIKKYKSPEIDEILQLHNIKNLVLQILPLCKRYSEKTIFQKFFTCKKMLQDLLFSYLKTTAL